MDGIGKCPYRSNKQPSAGKNLPKQAVEPILGRNGFEDRMLWRLSLILREIADDMASPVRKQELPRQAPPKDTPVGSSQRGYPDAES